MKTTLFVLVFLAPVAASANPEALDQLQECAAGHCWDTKGQPVTAPAPGSVLVREPSEARSAWNRKPPEPPRYTVLSKGEVEKLESRQRTVGTVVATGIGAMAGIMLGGLTGGPVVALALVGAAIGFAAFRLMRR